MTNPASSEPKPRSRNPWKVAGIVFLVVCGIFGTLFLTGSLTLSFDDDNTEVASVQENVADGDCPEYIVDDYWPDTVPTDCVSQLVYTDPEPTVTTTIEVPSQKSTVESHAFDRICDIEGIDETYDPSVVGVVGALSIYSAKFPFAPEVRPVYGDLVRIDYVRETVVYGDVTSIATWITKISPAPADEVGDIPMSMCEPPTAYTNTDPTTIPPSEPTTTSAEPTN